MARFTNQAQLRYGNAVTNSNVAVGEILEVLSATKTAVKTTYGQNDTVTYIISIVNSGATAFNGLTLTDDLGAYTFGTGTVTPLTYIPGTINYYINGTLQTAPTVEAGPPLTVSGISVPATGSDVVNTARITGGGITPITISETIAAESTPILNITKSVSPVPVTENGILTYTFLIQNMGSAPATVTTGATITDTFNPILSGLTVTFNGTAWTAPTNYTYNETTGLFATAAGQITVPAATFTQDPETGA